MQFSDHHSYFSEDFQMLLADNFQNLHIVKSTKRLSKVDVRIIVLGFMDQCESKIDLERLV